MRIGRLRVSAGALVVAALLLYLDREGIALAVLLSCLAHELGHWWAIQALGGRVTALTLTCTGAELRLSQARPLPPMRLCAAALAGPGANLLLAGVRILLAGRGAGERLYLYAGIDLGLAAFNLLPASWLDGGKALIAAFSALGRRSLGEGLVRGCSALITIALILVGGDLLWLSGGRNFTVLLAGLWMALAAYREKTTFQR